MVKTYIIAGIIATSIVAGTTAFAAEDTMPLRGAGHIDKGAIVADLLGITQDEFISRVKNGEKPKEMLESAGITKEDMESARATHMRERLAKAVADGKITQAQADEKVKKMELRQAKHESIRVAITNNDYDAFIIAVADTPLKERVTRENFAKFVEAHRLHEAGDHNGAKAIMDELGLKGLHKDAKHTKGMGSIRSAK